VLAIAPDMEKAVVVRELSGGQTARTAVVDRPIAQAMALKDWITCVKNGRIARYGITTAGRTALKRLLAEAENVRAGFAEAPVQFGDQHRVWGEKTVNEGGKRRAVRYIVAESPLATLARRKDKNGKPFLTDDLVAAGERLREDFELAQMGPRVAQNWERFLTGGTRGAFPTTAGWGMAQLARAIGYRKRCVIWVRDWGMWCCGVAVIWKGWKPPSGAWVGRRDRAKSCCALPCSG